MDFILSDAFWFGFVWTLVVAEVISLILVSIESHTKPNSTEKRKDLFTRIEEGFAALLRRIFHLVVDLLKNVWHRLSNRSFPLFSQIVRNAGNTVCLHLISAYQIVQNATITVCSQCLLLCQTVKTSILTGCLLSFLYSVAQFLSSFLKSMNKIEEKFDQVGTTDAGSGDSGITPGIPENENTSMDLLSGIRRKNTGLEYLRLRNRCVRLPVPVADNIENSINPNRSSERIRNSKEVADQSNLLNSNNNGVNNYGADEYLETVSGYPGEFNHNANENRSKRNHNTNDNIRQKIQASFRKIGPVVFRPAIHTEVCRNLGYVARCSR